MTSRSWILRASSTTCSMPRPASMENTTSSPSRKAWRGWSPSRTGTKIVRSERAVRWLTRAGSSLFLIRQNLLVLTFLLDQRHACHADVVLQDGQCHGREAAALARAVDADAGAEFEQCAVFATHQTDAVGIQKLVALPIQVHAVVRAFVDVAKNLPAPANHEDVPGPVGTVISNDHELKAPGLLARNITHPADCVGDTVFHLSLVHGETTATRVGFWRRSCASALASSSRLAASENSSHAAAMSRRIV